MSGQANGQFPPNYQDFGGQPNQQVSGAYGQGNSSSNAPPVTRGSVRQVQPNFPQPAVSNPQQQMQQQQMQQQQMQQQQMLQQQMPRQTNPQPAAIRHVNSQASYAPLTSSSHNNNDQSFSPQLGGEPDVASSPHVNGQHLEPHQGGAQVAVQTPPSRANESTLEKILAELRTLNSMFQRQEADRAGIIFDNSRMYESIMSMAMKLVETVSAVGVNVQRQFSFHTARSLQNDAEANFNHLSGRYSTDGNGYISQSVTIDPQNIDPQNSNQQNTSQQNMNHPNLDNMNNQNM
ncbi:hypothetical protein H633G_11378 [Metarhizium anisopliae BRIP 53284]|nr:hypothetical protein H633G_11378 [Metarhizium anisopliae BRIP 53284]